MIANMKAARMHEYGKALILEDIPVPDIQPEEILVNVKACGMCRSDVQLVDGYFRKYADIPTPITLGHEITGVVSKIGSIVPKASGFEEGDHVVVAPGWGDGTCRHCQIGNTHICPNVRWPGFGPVGGFAEFIPVPARYLIKVDSRLKFEELAPLTDAGLTPYRGIKKLRDAGALGPDRVLGVFGVGGLGGYAVQYAKLLGSGAKVVAFGRNADKLNIAKRYGADHVISIKGKSSADIAEELIQAVGQKDLDAIMDCAGATEMMQLAFSLLSISGHYADVGLVGDRIDIPLFPRVSREQTFHGSFWGNYTDLSEVMALAAENKIRHSIKLFKFDEINENLNLLRPGDIVGRAVMKF
jgi:alcohol dehydrogenase, propanol-preferring